MRTGYQGTHPGRVPKYEFDRVAGRLFPLSGWWRALVGRANSFVVHIHKLALKASWPGDTAETWSLGLFDTFVASLSEQLSTNYVVYNSWRLGTLST